MHIKVARFLIVMQREDGSMLNYWLPSTGAPDPSVTSRYATGEAFWALTSPSEWTWEYNLTTGLWNERASYQRNDWRARSTIRAFDLWLCGDAATGDLFEVAAGLGSERGEPLVYTLFSGVLSGGASQPAS